MEAMNDHIREEHKKNRITGPDYSKVYLGGLQSTMQQAITFLLGKQEADKNAELISQKIETEKLNTDLIAAQIANIQSEISLRAKQEAKLDQDILVAEQEVLFSQAKVRQMQNEALLTEAQTAKTVKDVQIADEQVKVMQQEVLFSIAKVEQMQQEALLTTARVALTEQQVQNAIAETLVTARQADKIEQDILLTEQQVLNMQEEVAMSIFRRTNTMVSENAQIIAQTSLIGQQELTEVQNTAFTSARKALTDQQVVNLVSEELKIDAEKLLVDSQKAKVDQDTLIGAQQVINMAADELKTDAETALIDQNRLNAVTQNSVITNQASKLLSEIALLDAKKTTEDAQTSATGVDLDSVIGRQKALYAKQTEGFDRDAEQKLAKILVDSWGIRFANDPNAADVDPSAAGVSNARIGAIVGDAITGVTGSAPPA